MCSSGSFGGAGMRRLHLWFIATALASLLAGPGARADYYYTPNTGVYWSMDSLVVHSGGIVTASGGEYVFHGTVYISSGNFWGTTDITIIDSHIFGPVDFLPLGETSVQQSTWGRIKSRYR
jgi:hypothetical protein